MPFHCKRSEVISTFAPLAAAPAAAFAVHQLRYWLAFGGHAGALLQAQGHAYMHSLVPWLGLLLALAAGLFLRALGKALGGSASVPAISFAALWLACAASLVVLYFSQELLEGMFAAGHPAGLAGIFGDGGWWAIPAATAVGLVLAAVFHGARLILREVADRARRTRRRLRRRAMRLRPREVLLPSFAPLAGGWSGRGPPS